MFSGTRYVEGLDVPGREVEEHAACDYFRGKVLLVHGIADFGRADHGKIVRGAAGSNLPSQSATSVAAVQTIPMRL